MEDFGALFAGQSHLGSETSTINLGPASTSTALGHYLADMTFDRLLNTVDELCSEERANKLLGYSFTVGMEFDIILFVVFLGTLVTLTRHRNSTLAFVGDLFSSFYLLYSTYNRTFILRHTGITHWVTDLCAEGAGALIYDYIFFSVVSWMASSVLEYSSSLNLAKLEEMKLRRFFKTFSNISDWSFGRFVVLGITTLFTLNSLALSLVLWGFVQKSLGSLAQDVAVLTFLTIAAFLRLARQLMEGVTLITGIASREFKWRNRNSENLFRRLAFSSFVLLIHSSSLTYTFAYQEKKVWGSFEYTIFAALCVDVLFRLFVGGWAILNSCCWLKAVRLVNTATRALVRFPFTVVSTMFVSGYTCMKNTVLLVYRFSVYVLLNLFLCGFVKFTYFCLHFIWHFLTFVYRIAKFIFVVTRCVYRVVGVLLTQMLVAWQTYIVHRQHQQQEPVRDIDGDRFLVREETNGAHESQELVCTPPAIRRPHRQDEVVVCAITCNQLDIRLCRTSADIVQHSVMFPPCHGGEEDPVFDGPRSDSVDSCTAVEGELHCCRLEVKCIEQRA